VIIFGENTGGSPLTRENFEILTKKIYILIGEGFSFELRNLLIFGRTCLMLFRKKHLIFFVSREFWPLIFSFLVGFDALLRIIQYKIRTIHFFCFHYA
jgi:hypothetical protein